jgi:CheY-like chemotaxis protein
VLVLEATYGSPFQVRPFQKVVGDALVSLVESALKVGPVYIFGYHGKLQEVMQILYSNDVKVPFLVPEKIFQVSKVCELHGMQLGKVLSTIGDEAKEIVQRNEAFVAFYHMNSKRYVGADALRICVSGWEFSGPLVRSPAEATGGTVLKRCREIDPLMPVIVITGVTAFDVQTDAIMREADSFFQKPFSYLLLINHVGRWMKRLAAGHRPLDVLRRTAGLFHLAAKPGNRG